MRVDNQIEKKSQRVEVLNPKFYKLQKEVASQALAGVQTNNTSVVTRANSRFPRRRQDRGRDTRNWNYRAETASLTAELVLRRKRGVQILKNGNSWMIVTTTEIIRNKNYTKINYQFVSNQQSNKRGNKVWKSCVASQGAILDLPRTRTWNLLIRSQTRYPITPVNQHTRDRGLNKYIIVMLESS